MWHRLCSSRLNCILKRFGIWCIYCAGDGFSSPLLYNKTCRDVVAWNSNYLWFLTILWLDFNIVLLVSPELAYAAALQWRVSCTFLGFFIPSFLTGDCRTASQEGKAQYTVGGELLYNVVLVSAVQQTEPALCVRTSPRSWASHPAAAL